MNNTLINADAVKAISVLSTFIADANKNLKAEDIAEIVNNYVETAININADIKECIENDIYNFENNVGRVLKVTAKEEVIIGTVNALALELYGEDTDIDCTDYIENCDGCLNVALCDFFRKESDFNVRVCYTNDKKHLLIAYTEVY